MATATATPWKITTLLREDFVRGSAPHKVDRDKGIIYGVKVLGLKSLNSHDKPGVDSTEYTLDAMRSALPLYEGADVYKNHRPANSKGDRDPDEKIGWLKNAVVRDDGIYADVHLFTTDQFCLKLMEAAEKRPEAFGLSHHAYGRGPVKNRIFQIQEIVKVESVDVVDRGATTKSLFESNKRKSPMPTIRELIEASADKPIRKKYLTRLLEMGMLKEEDEMTEPEEPAADPQPETTSLADVVAMLKKYREGMDEGMVKEEYLAALDEALAKLSELVGSKTEEADGEEEEMEEGGSTEMRGKNQDAQRRAMFHKDPENPYAESAKRKKSIDPAVKELREELATLKREKQALKLCREASIDADEVLLESLMNARDEAGMKRLIERERKRVLSQQGQQPRSQPPGRLLESQSSNQPPSFPKSREEAKKLVAL